MKKEIVRESIWLYPRPPSLVARTKHVVVVFNKQTILDTHESFTVCETSHPPAFYFPRSAFAAGVLREHRNGGSFCEWKGDCSYFDVTVGDKTAKKAAWSYADPTPRFAEIAGYVALYAGPMDSVTVDDEKVVAQPGDFYGGWYLPSWVDVGEKGMKGPPGTHFW